MVNVLTLMAVAAGQDHDPNVLKGPGVQVLFEFSL